MTREEQIKMVWWVLATREVSAPLSAVAAQIVDALAQPVEVTNDPGHDWWPTPMKDTGTDPPRYLWRCDVCHLDRWSADPPDALDPDHPCESVQAKRDLTERVSERNQRIKELRPAQPGEWAAIAAGLDEYHAVNLLEALKLVPDTGDWHGSLRASCQLVLTERGSGMRPNRTAQEMIALAQPVEVTDEMVERAWNAGRDDLPAGQRWDKSALRVALRAALEAGT